MTAAAILLMAGTWSAPQSGPALGDGRATEVFGRATPDARAVFDIRIQRALEPFARSPELRGAAESLVAGRVAAVHWVHQFDKYAPAAMQNPRYAPLALGQEHYDRLYEETVRSIEVELLALRDWRPPEPRVVEACQGQMVELAAEARELLATKIEGPTAAGLVQEHVSAILRMNVPTAGGPLHPLQQDLTADDFHEIRQRLRHCIENVEPVRTLTPEEEIEAQVVFDENDDESAIERRLRLRDRLDRTWEVLDMADRAFLEYMQKSDPVRAESVARLEAAQSEAYRSLEAAYGKYRDLIEEIEAATEVEHGDRILEGMRSLAKKRRDALGTDSGDAAVPALDPQRPDGLTPPADSPTDPESGHDGSTHRSLAPFTFIGAVLMILLVRPLVRRLREPRRAGDKQPS